MPPRHHFAYEIPQSIFDEADLFDDSTGVVAMTGSKAPLHLLDRFLVRLSTMIGVEVKLSMHDSQQPIKIYLSRPSGSDKGRTGIVDELRQFLRKMERSMSSIATHRSGTSAVECPNALLSVIGSQCREEKGDP
jgi:hypothetical protein